MVAGTAATVGLALANDRRLTPVFVEAAPQDAPVAPEARPKVGTVASTRDFLARRLGIATVIGVAVLALAASVPALTAVASSLRAPSTAAAAYGPPAELRAAAGVSGNWERSYSVAAPNAGDVGAAVLAGVGEQQTLDALKALQEQQAAAERVSDVRAASAQPYTMNAGSGLAPGTVLRARITIYGCTGPGGGFCNHMSSGGDAFEGAAACSSNLPFGTKLTIAGDPTGRVYECLDRGALAPTWVDVYFNDTTDGMAWQSALGATSGDITIVN